MYYMATNHRRGPVLSRHDCPRITVWKKVFNLPKIIAKVNQIKLVKNQAAK